MKSYQAPQERHDRYPRPWQRAGAVLGGLATVGFAIGGCTTSDNGASRHVTRPPIASSESIGSRGDTTPSLTTPATYRLPGDYHLPPVARRLFIKYGGRHNPEQVVSDAVRAGCSILREEVKAYDDAEFPDEAAPPDINKLRLDGLVYNRALTEEGHPPIDSTPSSRWYAEYAPALEQLCPEVSWPLSGREIG